MIDWLKSVGWSMWGAGAYIGVGLWVDSGFGWRDVFILLALALVLGVLVTLMQYRASKKQINSMSIVVDNFDERFDA